MNNQEGFQGNSSESEEMIIFKNKVRNIASECDSLEELTTQLKNNFAYSWIREINYAREGLTELESGTNKNFSVMLKSGVDLIIKLI